ncbi:MAG: recombinase family protein, partial [Geodermatophilaceae bacterium]
GSLRCSGETGSYPDWGRLLEGTPADLYPGPDGLVIGFNPEYLGRFAKAREHPSDPMKLTIRGPAKAVVVWRLDRLGRSLRHLMETVADLERRGVTFLSLTEQIDTSTPGGKLVFHLFGALAEFERDLIRERTLAGLTAARARGRSGGRPTVWTPDKLRAVVELQQAGQHDVATIARVLGVSRASVYRALNSGA